MRALLLFLVVLLVAWRWRSWREASRLEAKTKRPVAPDATVMVACKHCGVHVPADDAVVGALGSYCTAAHRLTQEP